MKYTTNLNAMTGDRVAVRNYRKSSGQWEEGTVYQVETHWHREFAPHNTYRVQLDRSSKSGQSIWLYVGDLGIRPLDRPAAVIGGGE